MWFLLVSENEITVVIVLIPRCPWNFRTVGDCSVCDYGKSVTAASGSVHRPIAWTQNGTAMTVNKCTCVFCYWLSLGTSVYAFVWLSYLQQYPVHYTCHWDEYLTNFSPAMGIVSSDSPSPSTPTTPGGSKLSPGNIFKNFFKCVDYTNLQCVWCFCISFYLTFNFCPVRARVCLFVFFCLL